MKISLIIPAYNEKDYIGACLEAVLKNSHGKFFEIIVVDNASSDTTGEIAARFEGVRVVREDKKGLTHARQAGFKASSGDIVAYVDADTRMPGGWVDMVEKVFSTRPEVVSLSGPPKYYDATPIQKFLLALGWSTAPLVYRIVGYMLYGAHFAVRRKALEAIGGFDESISFYGEDTDLARRLSTKGKTMFRMDFVILGSARRFQKEGILVTNIRYSLNYLWPVLFGRPFTKKYNDVRV